MFNFFSFVLGEAKNASRVFGEKLTKGVFNNVSIFHKVLAENYWSEYSFRNLPLSLYIPVKD